MRRILFLLTFLCFTFGSLQAIDFSSKVRLDYDLGLGEYHQNCSAGGDFIFGIDFSDQLYIGIGGGANWCYLLMEETQEALASGEPVFKKIGQNASYIPLFLHGTWRFFDLGWSPYIGLDCGYAFMQKYTDFAEENADMSVYFKPAVGLDFKYGERSYFIEISGKLQTLDMKAIDIRALDYSSFTQVGICVGYKF